MVCNPFRERNDIKGEKMIILIGESGSGKTTILNKLVEKGFEKAINHTTRLPRDNEKNTNEYKFISKDEFNKMWENGELLQRAEFNNEYYGISTSSLKDNVVCISIVDSVKDIKNRAKELNIKNVNIITIYVYVSEQERINRMKQRGDTEESIATRLKIDKEKFKKAKEIADFTVENIYIDETVNKIIKLTKS